MSILQSCFTIFFLLLILSKSVETSTRSWCWMEWQIQGIRSILQAQTNTLSPREQRVCTGILRREENKIELERDQGGNITLNLPLKSNLVFEEVHE